MGLVRNEKCETCDRLKGESHKIITPRPTDDEIQEMIDSGIVMAIELPSFGYKNSTWNNLTPYHNGLRSFTFK